MALRENDHQIVRTLGLFAGMSDDSFARLLRGSFLQRFPAKVQLVSEGEPADFLHVAVEGRVELFASANNRDSTMTIVEPAATFILAAAVIDAPYLMSARTLEPCRVLMIPSTNVRGAFDEDPSFACAMALELSTRYREIVKALKNQKLRTGVERLANYLLRQHQEQGSAGVLELRMEKSTLASLLGMTPENLSRAFTTLRAFGVEAGGSRIQLTKLGDLTVLAKPAALIDDAAT
jgi:CRP/FNR family transcriptional regulator, transcriptional activator FtrB